jgi:hypothetical protein
MIIQTLVNLVIFSFFMIFSFQAIQVISTPLDIESLKYEYLQLQIDTLSSYYMGANIIEDQLCFTQDICLIINNERLILTPGHQILLEDIQEFKLVQEDTEIILKILKKNQWQSIYVKHK